MKLQSQSKHIIFKVFKSLNIDNRIMTTYESYSTRYSKSRQRKINSISPSRLHNEEPKNETKNQLGQLTQNQLGNVISRLSDRVDGIDIKITSITNIVKLLQKYTETRDQQYQREKQNEVFKNSIGTRVGNIQSLDLQRKFRQIQVLSQRVKSEVVAIQSMRQGFQRETSKKKVIESPQIQKQTPFDKFESPTSTEAFLQVHATIAQIQATLREQMNRKIQICMDYFKKALEHCNKVIDSSSETKFASPKTVISMNSTMLQEQLHNLTLTVNKIESDCLRNKMITDKKFEEIVSYIGEIKKNSINRSNGLSARERSRSVSASRVNLGNNKKNLHEQSKSEKSSRSKRSKSISQKKKKGAKSQYEGPIYEQKKQKQNQLKQALRRKKQNQQKLRMKK